MARKAELKIPKYDMGDILISTNPISKNQSTVILISRWDITPHQRVAWMCKIYPEGETEFAVPESELSPIDKT